MKYLKTDADITAMHSTVKQASYVWPQIIIEQKQRLAPAHGHPHRQYHKK